MMGTQFKLLPELLGVVAGTPSELQLMIESKGCPPAPPKKT